ncbi:DUF1761 domain-containing protein [Solitalea koreensis]|uniref:DUF1761 domain-containing protein n=1 Tax=Solitalea koreensis TaxID=543615 RepID=A0A521D9H9_9SPHI|nr:DUF1761 domain-containing protein [Solitalea koreensis]SMO68367.1 Protein of unknown function [Solitalea koreensis]
MLTNFFSQFNLWAVLVASAAYFMLGAIWYSPALFANKWVQAIGKTKEELRAGANPSIYISTFISIAISVIVLSGVIKLLGANSVIEGLEAGLLMAVAFVGTSSLINSLFACRPRELYYIDLGYHTVGLSVAGIILGIWR